MPTWRSLAEFEREIAEFQKELEAAEKRKITKAQAVEGQKIARRAAAADLGGDPKFSGWKPRLATVVKPARDNAHMLLPTRQSAGPWTVAEFGRHADGGVGRFQGPGVNLRTGRTSRRRDGTVSTRGTRQRRGVRWNGVTAGKDTATDAIRKMDEPAKKIAEAGLRKVIRKHFDLD